MEEMKSDIKLKTSFRDKPINRPRKLPTETTKDSVLKTKKKYKVKIITSHIFVKM